MKPLIGVTVHADEGSDRDLYPNHPLFYVERHYVYALQRHNMNPVLLPVLNDYRDIYPYLELLDGLLLTGGGYLNLNETASSLPNLQGTGGERLTFECALLEEAVPCEFPILGICRGQQTINRFFGGTIVNLPEESPINHHQETDNIPGGQSTHEIHVERNSEMSQLTGIRAYDKVNSFHRQAVERPGEGLKVSAWCPEDGVIEAVESVEHPWLFGLQFHPEQLWETNNSWSRLFANMCEAAIDYRVEKKRG